MLATAEKRFAKFIEPVPESGCWLWTGCCMKSGYGTFVMGGDKDREYAHRASWRLFRGPITDGMHVLHRCDVRCCVNPAHLFLGTQQDNNRDAMLKGRVAFGYAKPNTRYSKEQVTEAKKLLNQGVRQVDVSRITGLPYGTVNQIKRGYAWRRV